MQRSLHRGSSAGDSGSTTSGVTTRYSGVSSPAFPLRLGLGGVPVPATAGGEVLPQRGEELRRDDLQRRWVEHEVLVAVAVLTAHHHCLPIALFQPTLYFLLPDWRERAAAAAP